MPSKKPVVILHGYSDNSKSFEPLAKFLKAHGFKVIPIWLADYKSMNDEISIQDLGQAMGRALEDKKIPLNRHSFDLICHSTGALVVRAYLQNYFYGRPEASPIEHLVMLAPANFGSRLAALGKSMLGRLTKGWDWSGEHLFETGKEILSALELASPISWELAARDLFDSKNPIFKPQNLYTTILIGSDAYDGMQSIIHEDGSDGVVRVSTANLNASAFELKFTEKGVPDFKKIKPCFDPIAFGVLLARNHSSIVHPEIGDSNLGELIIASLTIKTKSEYKKHIQTLNDLTHVTFNEGIKLKNPDRYHTYQTLVTRVHDQFGNWIPDYFLEFFENKDSRGNRVMQMLHKDILEKVTKNETNPSYRSFHFDLTDLEVLLNQGHEVDMSASVAALSERIYYRNPSDSFHVLASKSRSFLKPNQTLFLDIQIDRLQADKVFQLRKI